MTANLVPNHEQRTEDTGSRFLPQKLHCWKYMQAELSSPSHETNSNGRSLKNSQMSICLQSNTPVDFNTPHEIFVAASKPDRPTLHTYSQRIKVANTVRIDSRCFLKSVKGKS